MDRVIQRDAAAGLFHLLDAPSPKRMELFVWNLHPRRQYIHHHVLFYRQLEQQTADTILRIPNRTA